MGRDEVSGKNKKFSRHKEKVEEDLTEEAILAAMDRKKGECNSLLIQKNNGVISI